MNNIFPVINLIIFYCLLKRAHSYLIYPFKTYQLPKKDDDTNISLLFSSIFHNNIFISLDIGEPKQTIKAFLRSDNNDFYISEKPTNLTGDNTFGENEYFNIENSNTLEVTNESIILYPDIPIGNVSSDIMYFTNDRNETIKKKFNFILYHGEDNFPGIIGLNAILYDSDKKYNFINNLKVNDIINSYFWMINYTSDYEGKLIIGEQPHIFDPQNYKEEELYVSYTFLDDLMSNWGLLFDDIIFGEKHFRQYHGCEIRYEINYIKGNSEIENELDMFFNESIKNETCYKKVIKYKNKIYRFFYCDKEKYQNNMKYFKSIELYHYEFNYTFIMDYKDLFIEKDDKLILMIFFDNIPFDIYLGKPFLRKYSFLINQDLNILAFYKTKKEKGNNDNDNDNNNNYIVLKIILITLGVIILFSLGIFIGKYFYKERKKKKINNIDEDYDYMSKNEEIN